jgi:hypothetical protein
MKAFCDSLVNIFDEKAIVYQVGEKRFYIAFDDGTMIQWFFSGESAVDFLIKKGFYYDII